MVTKQPLRVNVHIKTTLRERFDDYFRIFFSNRPWRVVENGCPARVKKERQKETKERDKERQKENKNFLPIQYKINPTMSTYFPIINSY